MSTLVAKASYSLHCPAITLFCYVFRSTISYRYLRTYAIAMSIYDITHIYCSTFSLFMSKPARYLEKPFSSTLSPMKSRNSSKASLPLSEEYKQRRVNKLLLLHTATCAQRTFINYTQCMQSMDREVCKKQHTERVLALFPFYRVYMYTILKV